MHAHTQSVRVTTMSNCKQARQQPEERCLLRNIVGAGENAVVDLFPQYLPPFHRPILSSEATFKLSYSNAFNIDLSLQFCHFVKC